MKSSDQKRSDELTAAVEQHRPKLIAAIDRRIRNEAEAEDVFQEVVQEFIDAYDLGQAIENLGAWLVKVAQNKIIDRFRKKKSQKQYQDLMFFAESESTSKNRPDEEWVQSWLRAEIISALELLPSEQRDVFVMHELEGKSFEEIASQMGVSVNTLLSRKRYAVLFLRDHLKEVYDELE